MNKITISSNNLISKSNYFSFLLALFPLSFIIGNMAININLILIILSTFFLYKNQIFEIHYFFLDKIIFLFFIFLIFTGIYNDLFFYISNSYPKGINTILKSLFFLKYLMLYLSIRFLIEKKIINLKLFFTVSALSSLFVCFDIFYQFIFGKDIFGLETIYKRKLSGPFGDELIAGGYLQRFSLFSFFLIPIFYREKFAKLTKFIVPFLFIVFFIAIILSGNRMPLILFILSLTLILTFQKQVRKFFLVSTLGFIIVFFSVVNLNSNVKINFINFYNQVTTMTTLIINKDFNDKRAPKYLIEFSTFYDTWKLNKYIGGGIKNFRYYCHVRPNIKKNSNFICNMHPHNYYLEILTETGLIGFLIISLIFLNTFYISFIKKYFYKKSHIKNNTLIVPFIFLFIVEIFPLKSTGSFFTTGNATFLFLLMSITIGLVRTKNLIAKDN